MNTVIDSTEHIRELIRQNRYSVKQHAHQRMVERGIFTDDIETVILLGELVEENPRNFPLPTRTFMRFVRGEPLYVVVGEADDQAYVITVHWMDLNKWTDPWNRKQLS